MDDAQLPREDAAECYLIGVPPVFPDRVAELMDCGLAPHDFFETAHQRIWRAYQKQFSAGGAVDPVLVGRETGEFGRILECGEKVVTSAFISIEAAKIIEARKKRDRFDHFQSLAKHSLNGWTSGQLDAANEAVVYDWQREGQAAKEQETFSLTDLAKKYPTLNPPIVDGVFRRAEIVNFVGATKACKSWTMLGLGWSVVALNKWLNHFDVYRGRVLFIDNELHPSLVNFRVQAVARAYGINCADYADDFIVRPIRGKRRSIQDELSRIEPGEFDLIFADSKYRFRRRGSQENSNDDQTDFYDDVEEHAERLGSAICFSVHSTKGSQADKSVTDTGSGGGAQSRAVDAHLVLREHESPGVVVLDGALRSFAPLQPLALQWAFPIWTPASGVDPVKLKGRNGKSEERQNEKDREGIDTTLTALVQGPATARQLRRRTGFGEYRQARIVDLLIARGDIVSETTKSGGSSIEEYRLTA